MLQLYMLEKLQKDLELQLLINFISLDVDGL